MKLTADIIRLAKKYHKQNYSDNSIGESNGTFCIHDLLESFPERDKYSIYWVLNKLIKSGCITDMMHKSKCKASDRNHRLYRYVKVGQDPYKIKNMGNVKEVDIETGLVQKAEPQLKPVKDKKIFYRKRALTDKQKNEIFGDILTSFWFEKKNNLNKDDMELIRTIINRVAEYERNNNGRGKIANG
jgi:hypothetical protein